MWRVRCLMDVKSHISFAHSLCLENVMKVIAWILRILVLLVLVWLALLNNQTTTFSVMQGLQVDLPLIVLLFAFFVMGLLLGILVLLPKYFRCNGRRVAYARKRSKTVG